MDENLRQVTEEFITRRVGYHGKNDTEAVNGAYMALRSRVERLRESLTEEQLLLLRACENAYHVSDGETTLFYYKAGFGDAIRFLLGWGEQQ